ncbi:MAG: hypothetical protein WCZ27_09710 [Tissierellaceae bacterium]
MSPGNLVILALVVVFLFMFVVGSTEYSLPFFQRLKFDNVCNKYLAIIQANGGLSQEHKNELTLELEEIGFTDVSISAPTKLEWNTEAILRVEASYKFKAMKAYLFREEKTLQAVYENKTRVMTLER